MLYSILNWLSEKILIRLFGYIYSLFGLFMIARRFIDDLLRFSFNFQSYLIFSVFIFGILWLINFQYQNYNGQISQDTILDEKARTKIKSFRLIRNLNDVKSLVFINILLLISTYLFKSFSTNVFSELSILRFTFIFSTILFCNYFVFEMLIILLNQLSMHALNNFQNSGRLENIFWTTILRNWSINTTICTVAMILALGFNGFSFLIVRLLSLNETYLDLINLFHIVTFGSLISSYIFKVSIVSKVSDILYDTNGDTKDYKIWDQSCDLLADGTFSKLIVIFLIVRGLLSGWFDLSLFFRNNYIVLIYALIKSRSLSNRDSFNDISTSCRNLLILSILLDPQARIGTLITILGVSYILSPNYFRILQEYINFDKGIVGLIPTASAHLVNALAFFSLGGHHNMNLSLGFGLLPALLHLDQAGYVADIYGEKDSKLDLLDIIGNQNKGLFKFYITGLLGNSYIIEAENYSINNVSSSIFILVCGGIFYYLLRDIDLSKKGIGDDLSQLNKYKVLFVFINIFIPSYPDQRTINSFVLSGACADNLKKVQQLNLIKTSKETLEISKYLDIMGDFSKDIVYPLFVIRLIMDSLSIFSWIQIETRQWLFNARSNLKATIDDAYDNQEE